MVRTMSARLRRSFAQLANIGSMTRGAPAIFVAGALLIGLTLTMALAAPIFDPEILQFFGALTIVATAYMAYMMVGQTDDGGADQQEIGVAGAHGQRDDRRARHAPHQTFANRDAEQLAQLKARVCHDLRTPLNAVIGFSDMMHHEVLGPVGNEHYREYAAQIRRSAEHFQRAAEKTLAVTELLASPPARLREAINLSELIGPSLAEHQRTTATNEPVWEISVAQSVIVEGNRSALTDALHHLWSAGRLLAPAQCASTDRTFSVICEQTGYGCVDLHFRIEGRGSGLLSRDSELAPGAELSLLLARLGIEAAGGILTFEFADQDAWSAIIRLPLATQREFELN